MALVCVTLMCMALMCVGLLCLTVRRMCAATGLTLTLPMDQLIAANDAKLSARFVKMGLVPELASVRAIKRVA